MLKVAKFNLGLRISRLAPADPFPTNARPFMDPNIPVKTLYIGPQRETVERNIAAVLLSDKLNDSKPLKKSDVRRMKLANNPLENFRDVWRTSLRKMNQQYRMRQRLFR